MTMKVILQFAAVVVMAVLLPFHQDNHVFGMTITNQSDPLNQTVFTDFTDDNEANWLFNETTETNWLFNETTETNWLFNETTETSWLFNETTETTVLETTSRFPKPDLPDGPCGKCPAMTICATYWRSCTPPPHDCLLTADCKDYSCQPTHACEPYEPIFG